MPRNVILKIFIENSQQKKVVIIDSKIKRTLNNLNRIIHISNFRLVPNKFLRIYNIFNLLMCLVTNIIYVNVLIIKLYVEFHRTLVFLKYIEYVETCDECRAVSIDSLHERSDLRRIG